MLRAALWGQRCQAPRVMLGERVDQLDGHALVVKALVVMLDSNLASE
jgi:hypothetical protein